MSAAAELPAPQQQQQEQQPSLTLVSTQPTLAELVSVAVSDGAMSRWESLTLACSIYGFEAVQDKFAAIRKAADRPAGSGKDVPRRNASMYVRASECVSVTKALAAGFSPAEESLSGWHAIIGAARKYLKVNKVEGEFKAAATDLAETLAMRAGYESIADMLAKAKPEEITALRQQAETIAVAKIQAAEQKEQAEKRDPRTQAEKAIKAMRKSGLTVEAIVDVACILMTMHVTGAGVVRYCPSVPDDVRGQLWNERSYLMPQIGAASQVWTGD